jgi:hypothetical protein
MKSNNNYNGTKLTDDDEMQLLEELAQKIDKKEKLSTPHKRVMKEIAYKMFVNNPINEIINKPSNINEDQIMDIVQKTQNNIQKEEDIRTITVANDINHIKEQFKHRKNLQIIRNIGSRINIFILNRLKEITHISPQIIAFFVETS